MKFIHLRLRNSLGQPATCGGVTAAYHVNEDGSIIYAIARCNESDNYCRSYGRAKAAGRMNSPRSQVRISSDNHSSPVQRVVFDLVEKGIWNGI